MSRVDIVNQLYRKMSNRKALEFDQIQAPAPLLYFFSPTDISDLKYIATSNKLAAKPEEKYKMINQIMNRRGFKKLASGTNRVVYKFMEDQSIVVKTALDSVGMSDNPNEFYNQRFIKPYCTKVFEVTPCGTLGLFERVHPISSREEFLSVADDIYDIIINHLVGRYVIDDFGSNYFMNWAVRPGAHPVICDFPYVFELDGAKLICNKQDPYSQYGFCGGEIDYDEGFNFLICKKCGKRYLARDLRKVTEGLDNGILITEKKGEIRMNITVRRGDEIIQSIDSEKSSGTYRRNYRIDKKTGQQIPKMTPYEYRQAKKIPVINVKTTPGVDYETEENTVVDTTEVVEETPVTPDNTTPVVEERVIKVNVNTSEKTEEKQGKKINVKVTGGNIRDYIEEDNSKFNQNTSVTDQPTVEEISNIKTESDESEKEEMPVDTKTSELVDQVIDTVLSQISGDDDQYIKDDEEVVTVTEAADCLELEEPDEESDGEDSTDNEVEEDAREAEADPNNVEESDTEEVSEDEKMAEF